MTESCIARIREFNRVIWGGSNVKTDLFKRWCQGFSFSPVEFSALVQSTGGPCAIIATTQATIMYEVLFIRKQNLADITAIFAGFTGAKMKNQRVLSPPFKVCNKSDFGNFILDEKCATSDLSAANKSLDSNINQLGECGFQKFINGLR
ncbi:unnamed protein product [Schistosoma mattheei]|uniref:Uncharacterized protein n=1 Tax=Schistosoma mattheei TaxID=31246 RepID=A0A183Q606_9TREM|nr:unnamed protein product [Schistosoma mattheei]